MSSAEVNRNLAHAGLFLVAFELVKELVVKRVKGFYEGVTFGEGLPFKSYDEDVLARHKNVFEASLLYLRDHFQALSSEDLNAIQMLRQHRIVSRTTFRECCPIWMPRLATRCFLARVSRCSA